MMAARCPALCPACRHDPKPLFRLPYRARHPLTECPSGPTRWRRRAVVRGIVRAMPVYPYTTLPAARALVDRAWSSLKPAPSPTHTQRSVVVRAMCAMYELRGSMAFPRGYVQAMQERMASAGMPAPSSATLRWYRSKLQDDAGEFQDVPGVDRATLDAIGLRYGG